MLCSVSLEFNHLIIGKPMEIQDYQVILLRLFLSILFGGCIGMERTLRGRSAGFRTHVLVCTSSTLMMLLMIYQWSLIDENSVAAVRYDPSRMAQGIMTGIGFLGGGVIIKDKVTVRGLTTAACIWMTASIGVALGMGFYIGAALACLITIGTLLLHSFIERKVPGSSYGKLSLYITQKNPLSEQQLISLVQQCNLKPSTPAFSVREGGLWRYQMVLSTKKSSNFSILREELLRQKNIIRFSITPMELL